MSKRAASTPLSSSKAKRAKPGTNTQHTIQSFFAKSTMKASASKEESRTKLEIKAVVIDLCLDDEENDNSPPVRVEPGPQEPTLACVSSTANDVKLSMASKDHPSTGFNTIEATTAELPTAFPDLTVDPLSFSLSCPWLPNNPAPYSFLVHALVTLSSTRSRITITNTLVNALRVLIRYDAKRSLLPALYMLSNCLGPSYEGVEMNVGPSVITKAVQSVSGMSAASLRTLFHKLGDPGDVAYTAKSSLRTLRPVPPLLLPSVFSQLLKISALKGQASAKSKQGIVEKLLVAARGEEVRYLVRTLSLHLRVGAVRTTILTALGRALVLTPPSGEGWTPLQTGEQRVRTKGKGKGKDKETDPELEAIVQRMSWAEGLVKQVYVRHPHFGHIVDAVLEVGLEGLVEKVQLAVGTPLHPTLGSPTRSLDEIYERLGGLAFSAEFKYDGQRVQVHAQRTPKDEIAVRLFSRHLEDMTSKASWFFLDLETLITQSMKLTSFILDAEVVAVDPHTGSLRTFQELSNRPRKDVSLKDVKVVVCVYAFDLMYLNGEPLLDKSFRERRQLLRDWFPSFVPDDPFCSRLAHVESVESESGREAVEEFWERAVESQCEGLMIKLLDSGEVPEAEENPKVKEKGKSRKKPLPATYEPDKRTSAWLKLKKDYVDGLGDSLDLVPVGGWHGIGRKAGWWSPILLALWDPRIGKFVGVCKCMSGFSDAFYKSLNERYSEELGTCSKIPYADVDTNGLVPKAWFKPSEVWEIKGADITLSPVSQAAKGLVAGDRGLSLRFPRFVRVREDKSLTDASGPDFLARMWRKQEGKGGGADEGELVDAESESEPESESESE
ncbi:ATP-dependent DNA ligase [Ceratobasidium sp. AG-Ba]|nr:ATP-dependent DNA ligase [Ceratobasidium sp. AG-Ba]